MRIGQTSFIVFASKLSASVLGFFSTLYFARFLGAEVLGYYAVVLAVVSWLKLAGTLGSSSAIVKRVSEDAEPSAYFTAGAVFVFVLGLLITGLLTMFRNTVNAYIGVDVWELILLIFVASLFQTFVISILKGERKVHISGLLSPVNIILSSLLQVALVFAGFELPGLLFGYLFGEFLTGIIGLYFVSLRLQRPEIRHFKSIFTYAKYSWLGGVETQTFNDVDVLILGAFVPANLVGIYSVAWSLAKFLNLFGNAIRGTVKPELSRAEAKENDERISRLSRDSLTFTGLIAIPGFLGSLVLSDMLMGVYGPEFVKGATILTLLILATMTYGYQEQITGIMSGIDRPDLTFRVNAVFILLNLTLNILLIYSFGWTGAAVASVLSAVVGLILSYHYLGYIVEFRVPSQEILRQLVAAGVMAAVVALVRVWVETISLPVPPAVIAVGLVTTGAIAYFMILFVISEKFRETVIENVPITPSVS